MRKNLKKLIAMGLTAVMAVSVMSVSAFAKEIIDLGNGVTMTLYDDGEYTGIFPRTVNMTFSTTVSYSSVTYLKSISGTNKGSTIMTLDDDETELVVEFNSSPKYDLYQTMYDQTDGRYIFSNQGPYSLAKLVTYSGLPKGHKIKLGYKVAERASETLSGEIYSN